MDTYGSYYCTLDTVQSTLEKYGVAVIPNVMSREECEANREVAWREFKQLTSTFPKPIDRNDPSSFRTLYELFPLHSMLLQYFGVGQMQWTWNVRQHPNVVNAFAKIWDVRPEELITSFDGVSLHLPPETTNRGWWADLSGYWLHTDQSSKKKGRHCIQGMVNMYPVNPGDATLCILEGSHHLHDIFFETFGYESDGDWYKLKTQDEVNFFKESECEFKRVLCNEGDLVLWDSRTFHQGSEPIRGRDHPNFRMVSYVCMTPRKLCSEANLKKRINNFENGRTTNHWPHLPKLFPKTPRTYGKQVPVVGTMDPPVITELGRKLIGY